MLRNKILTGLFLFCLYSKGLGSPFFKVDKSYTDCVLLSSTMRDEFRAYHLSLHKDIPRTFIESADDLVSFQVLSEADHFRMLDESDKYEDEANLDYIGNFFRYSPYPAVRLKAIEKIAQSGRYIDWRLGYVIQAQIFENNDKVLEALRRADKSLSDRYANAMMILDAKPRRDLSSEAYILRQVMGKGPPTFRKGFFGPKLSESQVADIRKRINYGVQKRTPILTHVMYDLIAKEKVTVETLQLRLEKAKAAGDDLFAEETRKELTRVTSAFDENRAKLARLLLASELVDLDFLDLGDIVGVYSAGEVNQLHKDQNTGGNWRPPFGPDDPVYLIKTRPGMVVTRFYGGQAREFGQFYSPGKLGIIEISKVARESYALPLMNKATSFSATSLAAGEYLFLGVIGPQRNYNGEKIDETDWGWGAGGGDVQYWRPNRFPLDGKITEQSRLAQEQVVLQTEAIQNNSDLAAIQTELYKFGGRSLTPEFWSANFSDFASFLETRMKSKDAVIDPETKVLWTDFHKTAFMVLDLGASNISAIEDSTRRGSSIDSLETNLRKMESVLLQTGKILQIENQAMLATKISGTITTRISALRSSAP